MGEVGQHVVSSPVQRPPESRQLLQSGRDRGFEHVDHLAQQRLPALAVVVGVGGDDLLINPPGHLDGGVLIGGEHRLEPAALAVGE